MERLRVTPMILREMSVKRVSKADVSRALKINQASVQGMFKRQTMQVQKLADLSEMLQYNFFREIADSLPYKQPNPVATQTDTENAELKERVKALEMEVSILRQTLKDAVSK
jgi:hypothetical protein